MCARCLIRGSAAARAVVCARESGAMDDDDVDLEVDEDADELLTMREAYFDEDDDEDDDARPEGPGMPQHAHVPLPSIAVVGGVLLLASIVIIVGVFGLQLGR